MKNNRYNRKLEYIRTKNHVRSGGVLKSVIKVTKEFLDSQFDLIIEGEGNEQAVKLSKKYKNKITCVGAIIGTESDDFAYDRKSILLNFKKSL